MKLHVTLISATQGQKLQPYPQSQRRTGCSGSSERQVKLQSTVSASVTDKSGPCKARLRTGGLVGWGGLCIPKGNGKAVCGIFCSFHNLWALGPSSLQEICQSGMSAMERKTALAHNLSAFPASQWFQFLFILTPKIVLCWINPYATRSTQWL